jgi:hypothetical protein
VRLIRGAGRSPESATLLTTERDAIGMTRTQFGPGPLRTVPPVGTGPALTSRADRHGSTGDGPHSYPAFSQARASYLYIRGA